MTILHTSVDRFIYVDLGTNGQISDSTIWQNSRLHSSILNNTVNLPPPSAIPMSNTIVPYHIIGDDIFPLTSFMMKPYPRQLDVVDMKKRVFNYRLVFYHVIILHFFYTFIIDFNFKGFQEQDELWKMDLVFWYIDLSYSELRYV
jgi:hypothetical protein